MSTHRVPNLAGAINTGAVSGNQPAIKPAGIPYSITPPATGTASKFAGMLTNGSRPNTNVTGITTPTCAPSVIPSGSANGPSAANRFANAGPTVITPVVAPTDSQNPIDHTSNGSISTNPSTANARMRIGARSRPVAYAIADSDAIVPARTIDGSKRVNATNHKINPTVTPSRGHRRKRRSNGPQAASTNATFCPDTAVRWERPLALNRSIIACG